jgi:Glycosyl hydrolase family 65, N-terminal domain
VTGWSLVYEGFDPAQERLRETLCTLGNGYFATRGAAAEGAADEVHYPGTYLAGCYNRLPSVIDGTTLEHEDLVNAPNWLPLAFRRPGDPWFALASVTVLAYRQELDLRRGVLARDMRVRDAAGRTTRVQSERLVHMADRGSISFVQTATVVLRYAGFTILTAPSFLHARDRVHLGSGLFSRRLPTRPSRLRSCPRATSSFSRSIAAIAEGGNGHAGGGEARGLTWPWRGPIIRTRVGVGICTVRQRSALCSRRR